MLVVRWHSTPSDEEIRGYSSSGQPFPSILLVQVIPGQPVVQRFNLIIGKILQISFQNIEVIDTANIQIRFSHNKIRHSLLQELLEWEFATKDFFFSKIFRIKFRPRRLEESGTASRVNDAFLMAEVDSINPGPGLDVNLDAAETVEFYEGPAGLTVEGPEDRGE